jgi:uncharacterized protein YkwD
MSRSRWNRIRLASIVALLAMVLTASCSDDDAVADSLTAEERGVLEAINTQRRLRGLDPVSLREDLVCAAARHSRDVGERRECTHDGADGSGPGERVQDCGGAGWSGEIVACGQTTPGEAVDGWLDSPGHKGIMLDPGQRRVGVAMHNNYWTAIFHKSE